MNFLNSALMVLFLFSGLATTWGLLWDIWQISVIGVVAMIFAFAALEEMNK